VACHLVRATSWRNIIENSIPQGRDGDFDSKEKLWRSICFFMRLIHRVTLYMA